MIALPKIIVLASSTIGKASYDYWSQEQPKREKARRFVAELKDRGVYVAFTAMHVAEFLQHGDERLVRDRLGFLRSLPLVAWLRPYDENWFPGSIIDLLTRELHAVLHQSAGDWKSIVEKVRPRLWETGTGTELFVQDDHFWYCIRQRVNEDPQHAKVIASISRTRPFGKAMKIRDMLRLPRRPKKEWSEFSKILEKKMQLELERYGDKKLKSTAQLAKAFTASSLRDVSAIDASGSHWFVETCRLMGVPPEMVDPEMTTDQVGELAVYCNKLNLVSRVLDARKCITAVDVPPTTLPSYVLESRLARLQETANRVSGSDISDKYIAPLILYSDGIELDKRTHDYISRIRKNDRVLDQLMGRQFRCSDYSAIPQHLDHQ